MREALGEHKVGFAQEALGELLRVAPVDGFGDELQLPGGDQHAERRAGLPAIDTLFFSLSPYPIDNQ